MMGDTGEVGRKRRVLVIRNPCSGWRRQARFGRILAALVAAGCLVEVQRTAARGDAEAYARKARRADWDVIAVAGGDGTVNEVINGIDEDSPPVAVLPLGTANVVARELGMPSRPADIARVVASGSPRPVHIGVADGRRFLAMAGVGFDARVVAAVSLRMKRWLGRGAYVVEVLRQLVRLGPDRYRVTVDGQAWEAASLVIANARHYGGPFCCAPDARLDDPTLHVCLFERPGRIAALRYLCGLVLGRLPRMADVRIVPGSHVTVSGDRPEPVQADGDIIARLPIDVAVAPLMIRVLMP